MKPKINKKCKENLKGFWIDFRYILEAKMDGLGSKKAIKNQSKKQWNFECIFEVILEEKLDGIGRGGESPLGAWNSEFALGNTYLVTPCSPRGGRRIEDASRRHTAAPLLLG